MAFMYLVGANPARRTTTREYLPGSAVIDDQNRSWVYVQATEAVAIGTCTVSGTFTLTDAAGNYTADVAFLSGEYGWVRKTTSPL
jgi:hypothetical protein